MVSLSLFFWSSISSKLDEQVRITPYMYLLKQYNSLIVKPFVGIKNTKIQINHALI